MTRCEVCGARQPEQNLEPAQMRHGLGSVCRDGYECAQRANGKPRLLLVPVRPVANVTDR